jgi:ATP-dependent helicase/nuclease subunit B
VRHESIARGLHRYRQHIEFRRKRLPADMAAQYVPLLELLTHLENAAAPLQALRRRRQPAPRWLQALQESLVALGVHEQFAGDAAGSRILQELDSMAESGRAAAYQLDWSDFRAWLGRTLERFNFLPPASHSPVRLFNLAQSAAVRCDALIMAGAERDALPGPGTVSPFFNSAVRTRLGLPDERQRLAQRFRWFRALLQAAPQVLLTHRREDQGETIAPSPWLAQLIAFHQQAYGDDLQDAALKSLSRDLRAQVRLRHRPLPAAQAPQPSISIAPELLPGSLSATAYQSLMDCPYQFFAARCLQLAPPDAVREALEKSDYGERVHRCLEAFHQQVDGLPPPFHQSLTPDNRATAIAHMESIAAAVFARDLEDNFAHRGWYKAWLRQIPFYVDWEIGHTQTWRVAAVERELSREGLIEGVQLRGRLDRLDAAGDALGIIDYKTGRLPAQANVDAGEAVQLAWYALLLPPAEAARVDQVAYLALDKQQVRLKTLLAGAELRQLTEASARRLQQVINDMREGMALTAWGDALTCRYCKMDGLCRKTVWEREEAESDADA